MEPAVRVKLVTGRGNGAISILELTASNGIRLDSLLREFGIGSIAPGRFGRRRLGLIDEGIVARLSATCCILMPHGSQFIVQHLLGALIKAGAILDGTASPREQFPECFDDLEACVTDVLANSASPIAVDAVLQHEVRWRAASKAERQNATDYLHVLREPPRLVVVGRANVGKSSLTNAMAGMAVSVVSTEPGTTRDYIGVLIECDGLWVQWIDTPGVEEGLPQYDLYISILDGADLVIHCSDRGGLEFAMLSFPRTIPVLRCGTKADLGEIPGADVSTSVEELLGLGELAKTIRQLLAPKNLIDSGPLWRFHPCLPV